MSGQLAQIPSSPAYSYGPLLSSLEENEFRSTCSLLCQLPIPVRFIAPPEVYSEQYFFAGLLLLGNEIEEKLIEFDKQGSDRNLNVYIFCINVHCEIFEQVAENIIRCNFSWDCFTLDTAHYHGHSILDLNGNKFYNLTELLTRTRKFDH
jgi:hypothetical protein